MTVDLRPYISEYSGIGQTSPSESEGSADQWYNCTLECLRRTALDLGFKEPYDDEQLRNYIRAQYGSTGLSWAASVAAAKIAIPGLVPLMAIQGVSASGLLAQVRANIADGYLQHIGLWCDTNAHVPPQGPITYSHACRITADLGTGTGFALQNPEPWPDFTLTDAQMTSLYDGGSLLVFKKSLLPAPPKPRLPLFSN